MSVSYLRMGAVRSPLMVALAMVLVGVVGLVDWFTGYELSFSVFYLIPVSLAAAYTGKPGGWIVSVSAGAVWFAVEYHTHTYSSVFYPVWNGLVRMTFFCAIAHLISELRLRYAQLREQAVVDSLTGLLNTRGFYARATDELLRAKRYPRPITIAYLDLDDFKKVNDSLGHEAGDEVLRAVGQTLRSQTRSTDLAARLGGDEFAVLLPETDAEAAATAVAKLHKAVLALAGERRWPVGASVGVVTFQHAPENLEQVISAADHLMYAVKHAGKNGVRFDVRG